MKEAAAALPFVIVIVMGATAWTAAMVRIPPSPRDQNRINELERRVEKNEALLNKMAKGLGYDGPEYWH